VERIVTKHAARIPFAFCGHTHWETEAELETIRGYNIGGGYEGKRLLWLEWPTGTVRAHEFA
jgi:hypothetical protein